MPYRGIPQSKWAKLDRCVEHVMASPTFRQRYKARKKTIGAKSLAIMICRKTLKV
jgi:hypothetical protein